MSSVAPSPVFPFLAGALVDYGTRTMLETHFGPSYQNGSPLVRAKIVGNAISGAVNSDAAGNFIGNLPQPGPHNTWTFGG